MNDEQAIRDLVQLWMSATRTGDTATVLRLMADDVLFLVPGQEPFGKEAFVAAAQSMKGATIEGRSDIQELTVLADWAWMRSRLEVTITSPQGESQKRSGYTLTILRKRSDGSWVLARDANLLLP
jgi:uncharacterized protein (TIGR02246 family)